jgi:hypothetical protein
VLQHTTFAAASLGIRHLAIRTSVLPIPLGDPRLLEKPDRAVSVHECGPDDEELPENEQNDDHPDPRDRGGKSVACEHLQIIWPSRSSHLDNAESGLPLAEFWNG